MVTDGGQLYTIEGVAAALIMVMTAYLVVNATSVYTAGDTHISDMQLETMATDALTVMDSPVSTVDLPGNSSLRSILNDSYTDTARNTMFQTRFLDLVNAGGTLPEKDIQFNANYTCMDNSVSPPVVISKRFSNTTHPFTGTEHTVKVTKWVLIEKDCIDLTHNELKRPRAALVEVLLWVD